MSTAENSDRRRKVIIMQSDQNASGRESDHEPKPKRLRESDLPQSLLTQFRQACGQTSPMLMRISSSESGSRSQACLWDRPSLIIGRGRECDLRLPHAEVSRQHIYLQIVGGRVYCSDLGSASGTQWGPGGNSRGRGFVNFGVPISVGPYSITIEPAPQYGTYESAGDDDESPTGVPDGLFLDFRDGQGSTRRWPATRDVTIIGSGSCAKAELVHPSVSKTHCAVVRTGRCLWVVDLLSEEGTLVNGALESVCRLESGDLMQIGCFEIATHYGSPLDEESINIAAPGIVGAPKAALPDPSQDLARLQQHAVAAAQQNPVGGGVSEQFVLDVINQMGAMHQQALQHAQQSLAQALQAVTASYQGRIEALEKQHESLNQQLRGLPDPTSPGRLGEFPHPRGLPEFAADYSPLMPLPPHMLEPEYQHLPEPEHGSFECDDPEEREQYIRQKMKLVQAELDKTRKGWGKRLIDLMGY